MVRTYFITSDKYSVSEAQYFAEKYNLEFVPEIIQGNQEDIYVEFIDRQIFLSFYDGQKKVSTKVNFSDHRLQKRSNYLKEGLIKAIGKVPSGYKLYDLTAGFAKDSFILASYGYDVILLEKHPLVYATVKYAIDQLEGSRASQRMNLIHRDSIEFLDSIPKGNNIFYLDPMFSRSSKSKVKKEMQLLQKINPPELDIELFLQKALAKGTKVILKRPINAPPLINLKPHHTIKGSKIKFSIYQLEVGPR